MGEQEKSMRLRGTIEGLCSDLERCRARIAELEESEERLAEIVRRSINLRVFVYENPKIVANGYYIDAKVALEKRPPR